jgi:RNA polymerase sigma-70 factor (ECF subfamily)
MLTEKEQVERSKTSPACFEPLYVKYYEGMIRFVYKRVESFDDTKEIVSVVFTKALTNIGKYKDKGFPFSSWLFRIAINEINQFYRDSKKLRAISLDEKGIKNIAAETAMEKNELISNLKRALTYLSDEDLLLIELRFFEERPFAEVAQILGVSENHAKVKTYRVLDKLRSAYARV